MEDLAGFGDNWQDEVRQLRYSSLPLLVLASVVVTWGWLLYAAARNQLMQAGAPAFVLLGVALLVYRLGEKHNAIASWLFPLGLSLASALLVAAYPQPSTMAVGVVAVILANALLGPREALTIVVLTWVAGSAAGRLAAGAAWPHSHALDILVLYLVALGAAWLAAYPLRASVEFALNGWKRARVALAEVQERRAELYRVVRALEEATYRIEHMNNELLVAQREAEEARALKARFAATVSHEIRNPLNLILGFSRLMALFPEQYGEPLPRSYRQDVDTIYRNSQHLLALVDDVLDLSQIESQRLPLVKDRVDLVGDVIDKVASAVRPLAERKGLYLRVEAPEGLPWLVADAVRLRQALMNLLTNAVRFTMQGGVTLRAARQEQWLVVSVQDTGPGIPSEELPNLFKEFRQVQVTETREGAGSGLGLSICKHLVELHGGQLWAESEVGVGTTFHLTLPLSCADEPASELLSTGELQWQAPRRSCLVVHDDPSIVRLLGRQLDGYDIVGAVDEEGALSLLGQIRPHAVVTTPDRTERVAAGLHERSLAIPVVSCWLPRASEQRGSEGILAFLSKPVTAETLAAVMKRVERDGETTLLLVDDDPDAVRLLEAMLTPVPRPYRILKVYDGAQALEVMGRVVPDVAMVDWVMPGVSGEQLIAAMRADERLCQVPVVVISAHDWLEDKATLGTEVRAWVAEPLSLARGIRCLQALLDSLSPGYLLQPAQPEPSR